MAEPPPVVWRKQGMLFGPAGQGGWMHSHAQVPTVLVLEDRLRVFVASRPRPDLSLTGWVDLDLDRPGRVLGVSDAPILGAGPPGSFDEHGIMPSAVLSQDGRVWLYYSGWCRLAGRAPYHNATGLAVSEDGGRSFRRACVGPVLDRAPSEPLSATSPWVLRHDGVWHAFYSCGRDWIEAAGRLEHVYDIRHATSDDGMHWRRGGDPALPQTSIEEALTRPTLLRAPDGGWHMWHCHRGTLGFRGGGQSYRIGYAHSPDLRRWDRQDARAGIDVSAEGWDAEMIAYPCVVQVGARLLLFYNGNGFGRDGFGWAIGEVA